MVSLGSKRVVGRALVLQAMEYGLWVGLLLTPVIYLSLGSCVSNTQLVSRIVVVIINVFTIILIRYNRAKPELVRRSRKCSDVGPPSLLDVAPKGKRDHAQARLAVVFTLLLTHCALICVQAFRNAPTMDEVAHLPSGIYHWQFGDFTLYSVNPPVVRMLAALPMLFADVETDWRSVSNNVQDRSEFSTGILFLQRNGEASFRCFSIARLAVIPLILLGGWAVFRWAEDLFGIFSGIIALTCWCFCPNLIGWGAQITPDAGAAAAGVLAGWRFRTWLHCSGLQNVIWAGLSLGLALLTKSSWILLFILWPMVWLFTALPRERSALTGKRLFQFAGLMLLGLYTLNAGYGFEGFGKKLDSFQFHSQTLAGDVDEGMAGNRFVRSMLGDLPIPLPANYVRGIDIQKRDFERTKWSYLLGEQKKGGWWYYYFYAALVKTPAGYTLLLLLALMLMVSRREYRLQACDEVALFAPAVVLFLLVSINTGFNRYLRYVLPAFPFICVFVSRVGVAISLKHRGVAFCLMLALSTGVTSSAAVFPHSLSYFNAVIGGPLKGRYHLVDANVDWGQDLLGLKSWVDRHPEADPLKLKYFGIVHPRLAGLRYQKVMTHGTSPEVKRRNAGWYALSVNYLMGYRHYDSDVPDLTEFEVRQPVGTIGYSIYLYYLPAAESAGTGLGAGEPYSQ